MGIRALYGISGGRIGIQLPERSPLLNSYLLGITERMDPSTCTDFHSRRQRKGNLMGQIVPPPKPKKQPLKWTFWAGASLLAYGAAHLLVCLAALYVWVIAGREFPPFAKFPDGVISFMLLGGVGALIGFAILDLNKPWRKPDESAEPAKTVSAKCPHGYSKGDCYRRYCKHY